MINQAKSQGRLSLHPYTIGVITSIVECNYAPVDKVNGISLALEGMNKAWNDKSLPRDYADAKKAPLSEEAPKEICQTGSARFRTVSITRLTSSKSSVRSSPITLPSASQSTAKSWS